MPLVWFALMFAASGLLGIIVWRWLSSRQIVDVPNARSSHVRPTVRGGGLAIHGAIGLGLGIIGFALDAHALLLIPPLGVLAMISFWDDIKGVPAGARFCVHVMAATTALALLAWPRLTIAIPSCGSITLPFFVGVAFSMMWIVGMINAYNFMDGINGHAAFQTVITASASAIIVAASPNGGRLLPVLFLVVAGAAAGFLPHNFPKARMFMGDVGSVPLGAAMAILTLWSARDAGGEVLIPLVLLQFNFILDTSVTLARRALRGKKLSEPHREHLYERFAMAANSHARVVGTEMSALLQVAGLLSFYPLANAGQRLAMLVTVVTVWPAYYLLADWYCRGKSFGTPKA